MKTYTIEELENFVTESSIEYPNWRKGQLYFNCLYSMDPELANELRGSDKDPFYRDDRIPAFLEIIEQRWD